MACFLSLRSWVNVGPLEDPVIWRFGVGIGGAVVLGLTYWFVARLRRRRVGVHQPVWGTPLAIGTLLGLLLGPAHAHFLPASHASWFDTGEKALLAYEEQLVEVRDAEEALGALGASAIAAREFADEQADRLRRARENVEDARSLALAGDRVAIALCGIVWVAWLGVRKRAAALLGLGIPLSCVSPGWRFGVVLVAAVVGAMAVRVSLTSGRRARGLLGPACSVVSCVSGAVLGMRLGGPWGVGVLVGALVVVSPLVRVPGWATMSQSSAAGLAVVACFGWLWLGGPQTEPSWLHAVVALGALGLAGLGRRSAF